MSDLDALTRLPEGFDGRVRLFPLPNLVVFPNVLQPLHIFEPRYCDMLTEALESDQLITMATFAEGWEASPMHPRIEQAVCVGKIMTHVPTENGRHNLLLMGVRRGRIVREMQSTQRFRTALVEIVEDEYALGENQRRQMLKDELLELFQRYVADTPLFQQTLKQLSGEVLPLGPLTDLISFATPIPTRAKLMLLATGSVDLRLQHLVSFLRELPPAAQSAAKLAAEIESEITPPPEFPPPFSLN